jgi:omega-amidase
MRAHLVQIDIVWEDRPANHARADALIAQASPSPGDLIILPEMFDTGFSMNPGRAVDSRGEAAAFLASLARTHKATVVGGVAVQTDAGPRNRAMVFGPAGEALTHYDKRHLFTLGQPSEAQAYTPGDAVTTFDWKPAPGSDAQAIKVSPLICYDLRFPELFGRALVAGAQAIALIANWPRTRSMHWRQLCIARAIENQAFVFAVNRAGRDPGLEYMGESMVISPKGDVLAIADDAQQVLSVAMDPPILAQLHDWRRVFPAWRDRIAAIRAGAAGQG